MRKPLMVLGLIGSLALGACDRPKSKMIPTDPSKWDQLADSTKKLSEDDRKELAAYMLRMAAGSIFNGGKGGGIPPGTTIGDAIGQQKEFEAKRQAEEAQEGVLKAKVAAEHAAEAAKLKQAATVALSALTVLGKNFEAGRYSDRLDLVIAVQNHTPKAISGIKGDFIFDDQFGTEITRISLSLDKDIGPNESAEIRGYGKDINQFEASDNKLATTPLSKMHVTFDPEMIVFADGSKMVAPDKSE